MSGAKFAGTCPCLPLLAALVALAASRGAPGERLLGISLAEQAIFKLDTETGELIKFFGHPVNQLGGLDIDSAGNLYYMGSNILRRIDVGQPANDQFIGLIPGAFFESFEIVDDVGYSAGVFDGTFYAINLATAALTPLGQYGSGGADRITGLASTDIPGVRGLTHMYGVRVFQNDIIEVDVEDGSNLGIVIADRALNTTNLAYGPGHFWFVGQNTLYRIDLTLAGAVTPVLENLDIAGVDGLTVVHPEPVIATSALPAGTVGAPYGPLALEVEGGGPGIQWVALAEDYEEIDLGASGFTIVGVRQGLHANDAALEVPLPFPFPYYGDTVATVWVCTNGFVDLDGPATSPANSDAALIAARRIGPLWDDLRTNVGNRDVHIDTSQTDQITFRWDAIQVANGGICNFSCTLYASGVIEFDYGVPNANLTATVGISAGDGAHFIISRYSGQANMGGVDSLRFEPTGGLPPGLAISSAGVLAGEPQSAGAFSATIRLTDSLGGFDERTFPIGILAPCPADVSGPQRGQPDGTVNVSDLVLVIVQWGTAGPGDITGPAGVPDGSVNVLDLVAVILEWGPCP